MKGSHSPVRQPLDFSQTPFIVIWETTQACDLVCRHCRAEARDWRDPGELSTDEGKALLDEIAAMATPLMVLSGGDPLKRPDLCELISFGKSLGLRMATIPAATALLTRTVVERFKESGLAQMALSLDGATPESHDTFRGVLGAFEKTMSGIRYAHEVGLPVQVNTTVSRWNKAEFDAIVQLVQNLGIVFWEVFFLVPVGRGKEMEGLTGEEYEEIFAKLYELSQQASFIIKVTEAPHYRRFVIEQELKKNGRQLEDVLTEGILMPEALTRRIGPRGSIGRAPAGVNAGKGFCFISHIGEVYPSGFLPLSAGNVREAPLRKIYRNAPIFQSLRDAAQLKGNCGLCPFREVCGGSRSRAYAVTDDYLGDEPCCAFVPEESLLSRARVH